MIAIRPPEYFPRLSYFALLLEVDRFVLADTFEYSRQSYHNRTKLRNPNGWQWVTVPLEWGQSKAPLVEVSIQENPVWKHKHWRALMFNYRSTPYFEFYEDDFKALYEVEWESLGDLTSATVELVCELLEITAKRVRASELPGAPGSFEAIWEKEAGSQLLSLEDAAKRNQAFVPDLQVLRYEAPTYRQNFPGFEPGMSVLDVLFNYGPEAVGVIRQGSRLSDDAPKSSD